MNKFFKQKYAMSEQGAKNLQKSIFSHTILNLTKMFPPIIGFVFLFQYLGSLEGIPAPVSYTHLGAIRYYAILAASFAAAGMLLYFCALMVSHLFAFEVESNIIKLSVKKMMAKPLGFFANRESGNLRKTIVDGAGETHTMLAHQLPDLAMTIVSPIVLLVFFFLFDWRLGLVSLVPMVITVLLMATMATPKIKKLREEYYEGLANLSAESVEYVRGIPVVKTCLLYTSRCV